MPGRTDSNQQKWGGRFLLSNLGVPGSTTRATVIQTGNLATPTPINVQLRFAQNDPGLGGGNRAILPFDYPVHGGVVLLRVTVRRSSSQTASPTVDTYLMGPNDVFPIDTITASVLGIEVDFPDPVGSGSTTWVEAIATPVCDIGPTNKVYPYNVAANSRFVATNAVAVSLFPANSDRVQFFITNTSTDADLLVQFGLGPNNALPTWAPNPLGTLILPRNQFAVYESLAPVTFKGLQGFNGIPNARGTIYGIWSNAGTGGAMLYEGTAF
jgi:hypothetical protein